MLKNGLYNVISGVLRAGLAFISIPILIQLMGLEEYGLWVLVSSVLGMLLLVDAGLSILATTFVSKDLAKQNQTALSQTLTMILGAMLVLATFVALLLWAGASWFITFFPKLDAIQKQTVVEALHIGAIGVWAQLLQLVLIGVEQAYQRYRVMNLLKSLQWLFLMPGWFAVALSGGRTVALAQWQALVMVLSLATHLWFVYRLTQGCVFKVAFNRQQGMEIFRCSIVNWGSTLGVVLFTKCDRLVVGALLGSSSLGIYSAMVDFTSAINFFSGQMVQPLVPSVSYLMEHPDAANKDKLHKIIRHAVQLNVCTATSIGALILVFTPEILSKLLPGVIDSYTILVFQLLIIFVTLYSFNHTGQFLLYGLRRMTEHAILHTIVGIISFGLIFVGAVYFNLFGAILGNAGYLTALIFPILALRYLGFPARLFWSWIWMPFVSFVGVGFISILSSNKIIVLFAVSFHVIFCCFQLNFFNLLPRNGKCLRKL